MRFHEPILTDSSTFYFRGGWAQKPLSTPHGRLKHGRPTLLLIDEASFYPSWAAETTSRYGYAQVLRLYTPHGRLKRLAENPGIPAFFASFYPSWAAEPYHRGIDCLISFVFYPSWAAETP